MSDALAFAVTLGCLAAAALTGLQAVTGRFRPRGVLPVLVVLELALVVQAVLHVARLVAGYRPAETATHLAYLAVSVVVLPLVAGQVARDKGRWSALLLLVALLAEAVVVVRLQTTWRTGHA